MALNSGRMWPNRPESCVEVVEATTMDLSCAEASDICARAKAITNERFRILGARARDNKFDMGNAAST